MEGLLSGTVSSSRVQGRGGLRGGGSKGKGKADIQRRDGEGLTWSGDGREHGRCSSDHPATGRPTKCLEPAFS